MSAILTAKGLAAGHAERPLSLASTWLSLPARSPAWSVPTARASPLPDWDIHCYHVRRTAAPLV